MKMNHKSPLIISFVVLIGFPILFLFISLWTDNWKFFLFSLPPSMIVGVTTLFHTMNQIKKESNL